MTDDLARTLERLKREYLEQLPDTLSSLRKDADDLAAGDQEARNRLGRRLHQLAGSGGSHGVPELSRIASELEQWLAATGVPPEDRGGRLAAGLEELSALVRRELAQIGQSSC